MFFLSYTAWISLFLFSPARFTLFSSKKPLPKKDKIFFKFFQKSACIIFQKVLYYWSRFEAWLSLVERCVRDAEVASSNLVASTHFRFYLKEWPHGQAVKTTPSHGVNSGSIPDEVIESRIKARKHQSKCSGVFCLLLSLQNKYSHTLHVYSNKFFSLKLPLVKIMKSTQKRRENLPYR